MEELPAPRGAYLGMTPIGAQIVSADIRAKYPEIERAEKALAPVAERIIAKRLAEQQAQKQLENCQGVAR